MFNDLILVRQQGQDSFEEFNNKVKAKTGGLTVQSIISSGEFNEADEESLTAAAEGKTIERKQNWFTYVSNSVQNQITRATRFIANLPQTIGEHPLESAGVALGTAGVIGLSIAFPPVGAAIALGGAGLLAGKTLLDGAKIVIAKDNNERAEALLALGGDAVNLPIALVGTQVAAKQVATAYGIAKTQGLKAGLNWNSEKLKRWTEK